MTIEKTIHRLRYFCSDAWDEWCHSLSVNVLALITLTSTLFVAGLVLLVLSNVDRRVQKLQNEIRVEVYLQDEHGEEQRDLLRAELAAIPRVARVEYVDKEEALRRYREWAADLAELANELDTNPLPASLEVFLAPGEDAPRIAAEIAELMAGRPGVEEVRFDQAWLRRLAALLDLASVGGGLLSLLVFVAVIFVMASVLRLAVYARRDEIEIMQLVGATPGFIRGPFLVAGLAQGLIAALATLVVVELTRQAMLTYVGSRAIVLVDLAAAQPLTLGLSALLILVGIVVGLAGSYFAVRQPV